MKVVRNVSVFPVNEQFWSAIDLGEQRFLPIIERMKTDREIVLRRTDKMGRSAAIAATLAGTACALDVVVPGVGLAPVALLAGSLAFVALLGAIAVCLGGLRRLALKENR